MNKDTTLPTDTDRFQILALNGGGAKALFSAHVLRCLEEDTGISVRDSFDLVAGTSAGGIIALALGAGLSPAEIHDAYTDLVPRIFVRSRARRLRQLARSAYDPAALREALTDILGEKRLGDSHIPLVVPAWNVDDGTVHVFKTPHNERLKRDWKVPMVDVAMATSAAPTFFPATQVGNVRLIDGGVWANNPSVIAVAEAISLMRVGPEAIRVFNVSTTDEVRRHPRRLDNGGLVQWATAASATLVKASTRGAAGTAEHLLGKGAVLTAEAIVSANEFRLDRVDRRALSSRAESVARKISPQFVSMFGGHQRFAYEPLHTVKEVS